MLANSPSAIPEEHKLKETHSFSTRREKVRNILSKDNRNGNNLYWRAGVKSKNALFLFSFAMCKQYSYVDKSEAP